MQIVNIFLSIATAGFPNGVKLPSDIAEKNYFTWFKNLPVLNVIVLWEYNILLNFFAVLYV